MTGADSVNEPCSQCARPAVRLICALAYCHPCAETLLEPLRARHIANNEGPIGIGRQHGPLRPDWGEQWADLHCDTCNAGWVGPIGEPCTWCIDRHKVIIDAQRQVILHPDLPKPDDPTRDHALDVWIERLAHAVKAGIINEHQARQATRRVEGRHVA